MSIVGLLDVGGCRILDTDGFQALLGNAQRQRPIVIIAPPLWQRATGADLFQQPRADQLVHDLACGSALRFAGSSTPRSSRCEAADRMMSCVSVSFDIGISIRLARRRSPPPPQPHRGVLAQNLPQD